MKILVVDDSRHVHLQLKVFLKSAGYEDVQFIESAEKALEFLGVHNNDKPQETVELILMDINLEDMDGIEATHLIRANARYQDVPIIMITGDIDPDTLQIASDAGAVGYITKPFNKAELLEKVQSFLKHKEYTEHNHS